MVDTIHYGVFGLIPVSRKGLKIGRVAQLVEQVTFNHWVTGSNPVALTILKPLSPVNGTAAFFVALGISSHLPAD